MTVVMNVLSKLGMQAFGLAMPRIAWSPWVANGVTFTSREDPDGQPPLTLRGLVEGTNTPATWIALMAGTMRQVDTTANLPLGVPLVRADGTPEQGTGVLVTLFPQLYARLSRLYCELLETPAVPGNPVNPRGVPVRPVPKYFFYSAQDMTPNLALKLNGGVNPGDELGQYEDLRIYDVHGQPIDPLAVFSALNILLAYHPSLMWMPLLLVDPPAQNLLGFVAQGLSQGNPNRVRLRLCGPEGQPHSGAGLGGIGAVDAATGLCDLTDGLGGTVTRNDGQPATLVLGSPHRGTLGVAFTPPTPLPDLSGAITGAQPGPRPAMFRDFFTVRVMDLDAFLLGTPDPDFARANGVALEQRPAVRMAETLTPLPDGNDVLGAAQAVLAGAPPNSQFQCVAQALDDTFTVPAVVGAGSKWPAFAPQPATGPGALPPDYLVTRSFSGTAAYITVQGTTTPDVLLTLNNLEPGTAVHVFPRKFSEDAVVTRGDGAGAVVATNQTSVSLVLKDPFGLVGLDGTVKSIPANAVLRYDLALVSDQLMNGALVARIFGNQDVSIASSSTVPDTNLPVAPVANAFGLAGVYKSTCSARVLGLTPPGAGSALDLLWGLVGVEPENPGAPGPVGREPPRFPTMACRDLVVSSFSSAVISGGRLTPETLSAQSRLGSPGGPGGREVQPVGVSTSGGLLRHDLTVLGLRRTRFLPTGLVVLFGSDWDAPAAPAAGTFAGAVLQNTAPLAEMPGLYFLKDEMGDYATARAGWTNPANNFSDLVDWIDTRLQGKTVTVDGNDIEVAAPTRQMLTDIRDEVNQAVTDLNLPVATANLRKQRLFQELDRRVVTAVYGRRDTEWALRAALGRARRFVYIETPGLGTTRLVQGTQTPAPEDLFSVLLARMMEVPTLQVVLCTPRQTDSPPRFQSFIDYELKDRQARLDSLPADRKRVFHPMGFPGRPSRLATTSIIVDDTWALVGSSTLRRRGLTFDASSDLVFTDTVYEQDVCPSIAHFRRTLMARRLGIPATEGNMAHPGFVRLGDLSTAFDVVSEVLETGGGGFVEPLKRTADAAPITDALLRQANPDGKAVAEETSLWAELFALEYMS
ncbi:hypothetical protein [Myxococcus sp. Y35]|uniref:hypothetical protein n=1 Tax=Pseudomyxococcus flavus TaxID=3115648 RepID=UPI003CF66A08